ncbi:uncharacterized protein LY79DRAFT_574109 [Colletotrichum navitas]|uniref:Uncharacterized protein n=1 Tax=Colletotrichum navitas TaxID=681940 RepID=A0AAD8UXT8_9PEZI|nr:uncharacterized protein LY79DRAFT_574109 [Colletotrichum navitas]KAK1561560.1 hypothetical protein LY79DRAFT_574109 [Colletotrichum navitas]
MRRGGIEPPAPRRCWMATENFTTKPSALVMRYASQDADPDSKMLQESTRDWGAIG